MPATAAPPSIDAISALLSREHFQPAEPRNLEDTGLSEAILESLICKHLAAVGSATGRSVAGHLCLPFGVMEKGFQRLRTRQLLTHRGAAALNDYIYVLTEQGSEYAQCLMAACAYRGPAPVPLADYVTSVDAQTIAAEAPKRADLEEAFCDISVNPDLFTKLGPAVNSGSGLFLYGAPGNGKTTLAERITRCFGQGIWIPQTLIVEGEIVQFYDPAYHEALENTQAGILGQDFHDQRWIKVRRPTVIVGGELTIDALEIRHNSQSHVSEAPLQLKSNCGLLLIDDFGRQRVDPVELLNRWIIPLEKHYDYLTLASGKKIQVPFEQLIIFSTNLEPRDLVDEAFLRRIPYKINVPDPDESEFHRLFKLCSAVFEVDYKQEAVEYLLEKHYRQFQRSPRRCHPRDLLLQIRHYCTYNGLPIEMKPEYFDFAVDNYFTVVGNPCPIT
jgi:predicted ATPase with chaperone activity